MEKPLLIRAEQSGSLGHLPVRARDGCSRTGRAQSHPHTLPKQKMAPGRVEEQREQGWTSGRRRAAEQQTRGQEASEGHGGA